MKGSHHRLRSDHNRLAAEFDDAGSQAWRSFGLAVPTGFEPAISSLTGTYARPLHHGTGREESAFCAPLVPHYEEKEAASALPFTRRPAGVAELIANSPRGAFLEGSGAPSASRG